MNLAAIPGRILGWRGLRRGRVRHAKLALLVMTAFLTACAIPDRLDPRRLFRDNAPAPETVAGAETRTAGEQQIAQSGGEPYPEVGSVPARPAGIEPSSRQQVVDGLIADRQNARYTDKAIRPLEPPPSQVASTAAVAVEPAPAPVPAPATVVARAAPATAPVPPAQRAAAPPAPPAPPAPIVVAAAPPPPPPPVPPAVPVGGPVRVAPTAVTIPPVADPDVIFPAGGEEPPPSPRLGAGVPARIITTPARITVPPPAALPPRPSEVPRDSFQQAALTPLAPLPTPNRGVGSPGGLLTQIATIQFANDSTRLTQLDRRILAQVATLHGQLGGAVRVVGHSSARTRQLDPAAHALANAKLSQARADVVARALAEFGVDPRAIVVEARGGDDPLYSESMPTGEAGNRRTEVFIVR